MRHIPKAPFVVRDFYSSERLEGPPDEKLVAESTKGRAGGNRAMFRNGVWEWLAAASASRLVAAGQPVVTVYVDDEWPDQES